MFGPDACGPGLRDCPAAHRYYYVSGEPADAYPAAKRMLLDAGFEATRDSDAIDVYVYEPGRDPNELGIARDGFSIVEFRGYHNPRAERQPERETGIERVREVERG